MDGCQQFIYISPANNIIVRTAILIAVSLLLSCLIFPAPALAIGPVPVVTLSLSPATMDVVSNNIETLSVKVNGAATVQKGRFDRSTYTLALAASVDTGWQCGVSPEALTFSDSGTQYFNCTVQIPPIGDSNNITAYLSVDSHLSGAGFSASSSAESQLIIQTITGNQTVHTAGTGGSGAPMFGYIAAAVCLIAGVASLAYLKFYRKRSSK